MTVTCEYTRISLGFQMSLSSTSVSYTLPRVSCYNSIHQQSNLKIQPYPIWIRFVRVRHTGVYRVPHAVGRFHPTRTLFYPRHLGGFMGIFNPQIISRTQPLVIVSDLAKFKPLPMSDIKNGRNDRTRTCNLLAPNQAVYY